MLRDHIAIARPDHWFKNIFMLPGIALAMVLSNEPVDLHLLQNVIVAQIIVTGIVFLGNFVANRHYTFGSWHRDEPRSAL